MENENYQRADVPRLLFSNGACWVAIVTEKDKESACSNYFSDKAPLPRTFVPPS